MGSGYAGKILIVDLTSGESKQPEVSASLIRKYIGGRGWGSILLSQMVPKGADPLRPATAEPGRPRLNRWGICARIP
jgi:aldehyde:ferredoxin oxidoreductase